MSGKSTRWDETQFYSQLKQALWANNWPDIQQIVSHFIDESHSCLKGEATFFSSINIAEPVSGCFQIDKEKPLENHLHQCKHLSKFQNLALCITSILIWCATRSNVPFCFRFSSYHTVWWRAGISLSLPREVVMWQPLSVCLQNEGIWMKFHEMLIMAQGTAH